MEAPEELWIRLETALNRAANDIPRLSRRWADAIERVRAESDRAARAILAAHLSSRLVGTPTFECMSVEAQDDLLLYESVVADAVSASLDLFPYDEVERHILENQGSPLINGLRWNPDVSSRIRTSALKHAALERSDTEHRTVSAHRLSFLASPNAWTLGTTLIVDRSHSLTSIFPRVEAATRDGSHILVQRAPTRVIGSRANDDAPQPCIVDLAAYRYALPLDSDQPHYRRNLELVSFDGAGIRVQAADEAPLRIPFAALKYAALTPY